MIDGIHVGGQVLVVALGIAESGETHVLGVWQGASENTTVVKGLLEDLVDRGYLVVIDGSKALRVGVERVFGEQVAVQRCPDRIVSCRDGAASSTKEISRCAGLPQDWRQRRNSDVSKASKKSCC